MSEQAGLSVLQCPGCNAPVAPAREPTRCIYCGAELVTPLEYRNALDAAERAVESDALTREAFRLLGRPPSIFLRLFPALFAAGIYSVVLLLFGALWAAQWLGTFALDRCLAWLHVNAYDWLSLADRAYFVWGGTFFLFGVLVLLGMMGSRHVVAIGRLQAALAARPPTLKGGPSTCHECGAPLVIGENASGVRCLYCRADNLVTIPAGWVARMKRQGALVIREASAALAAERSERRTYRVRFASGLGALVVFAALAARWLHGELLREEPPGALDLRAALSRDRTLFDFYAKPVGYPASAVAPTVPVNGCETTTTVAPDEMDCLLSNCRVAWFVALRAGETLSFQMDGSGTATLYEHDTDRYWTGDMPEQWGKRLAAYPVVPGRRVTLRAPDTTWYRLEAKLSDTGEPRTICASLER